MLLQTNSYIVPKDKRAEHGRLMKRFRQLLLKLGCDQFEIYEQAGANWSPGSDTNSRFVQIMRFRDRKHQAAVQNAERSDTAAQTLISEFCELVNFPYQQQQGFFAVGFYISALPATSGRPGEEDLAGDPDTGIDNQVDTNQNLNVESDFEQPIEESAAPNADIAPGISEPHGEHSLASSASAISQPHDLEPYPAEEIHHATTPHANGNDELLLTEDFAEEPSSQAAMAGGANHGGNHSIDAQPHADGELDFADEASLNLDGGVDGHMPTGEELTQELFPEEVPVTPPPPPAPARRGLFRRKR